MPKAAATALRATTTEVQSTPVREAGASVSVAFRALIAFVLGNGLWFIWSNRFIPTSDYPDWVYQGFLFSRVLRGDALPGFSLKSYPVPNSIPTVTMGLAGLFVSPEAAGKLVMSAVIVLFALASIYLLKSARVAERNPVQLVPLLLVFNCWFFLGELSYLTGLGLLFLYAGYLLRRSETRVNGWIVSAYLLALFFAHPIPFAIGLLLSALYLLRRLSRELAIKFAAAAGIPIFLAACYAAARIVSSAGTGEVWRFWTLHLIAGRFIAAFSPFEEFLPWIGITTSGMKVAALVNLALALSAALALGGSVVVLATHRRRLPLALQATAISAVLFVAGGFSLLNWVGPGERFIYPAAWFALCWLGALSFGSERRWPMLALKGALTALIAAQILYLDIGVAGVSRQLADVYASLAGAKSKAEFCTIYEKYRAQNSVAPHRQGLGQLLNNIFMVTRLPYYLYIERAQSAPIFQVGMFDYHGAGDNENLCKDLR